MAYQKDAETFCEYSWGKPTLVGLHCACVFLLLTCLLELTTLQQCKFQMSAFKLFACHIECPRPEETGQDVTLNVHVQRRQDMMSH